MKIIHLSDLHVGWDNCLERFQEIARNIIFSKEPAHDYVIVITGDLVEDANDPGSYVSARGVIATLEQAGFMVLVCPGNHDYGCGYKGDDKFVNKFKYTFFHNTCIEYPKVDYVNGIKFIGLDSTAGELHWHDKYLANGELGQRQLDALQGIIADVHAHKQVVYMHHHPFAPYPGHELKDSQGLQEVLFNGYENWNVVALLYGHNHCFEPSRFWLNKCRVQNGKWGIPRCYDAGTSTHKQDRAGVHRVIDLDRDPRWDYDGGFL